MCKLDTQGPYTPTFCNLHNNIKLFQMFQIACMILRKMCKTSKQAKLHSFRLLQTTTILTRNNKIVTLITLML